MRKTILSLALMCAFAQGAWAQAAPEGLSIDTDYSSDQEGYYYVNLIKNTGDGLSITFEQTDLVFKVYDNGGKNGNTRSGGVYTLQLKAPEGYCFEVEGTYSLGYDFLVIYNSSWDDRNKELFCFPGIDDGVITDVISTRRTTSNNLYIKFSPQDSQAGFELTVRIRPLAVLRGEGTEESPYEVWSGEAWNDLSNRVAGGETFAGQYFRQMLDIDVTTSLGTADKAFSGHYDGNNHTMTCALNQTGEATAPFYKTDGAEIKNLYVTGTVSGGIHTAGLVAFSSGSRTTIDNCRVSATITCTGNDINNAHGGGFIGHAQESEYEISNCLFDGKLIAVTNGKGDSHLGAIVGWAGAGTRIIQTTIEKGTYEGEDMSRVAFCWQNDDSYSPNSYGGNYYFSDLGHSDGADKLISVVSGAENLDLTFDNYTWEEAYHGAMSKATSDTRFMIDDTFYTASGGSASFKLSHPAVWNISEAFANGNAITSVYEGLYTISNITEPTSITVNYSRFRWTDEGKYATEFANVDNTKKTVTIKTPEQLARLAKLVYDGTDSGKDWTYLLDADLDMSKYDWTPIGNGLEHRFCGKFDGQGHTISGINVPDPDKNYVGLFGVVNGGVYNLKLVNSKIEGKGYVGGIAGMVRYDIVNCYVGDDVTVTGSYESCGGVVGAVSSQNNTTGGYAQTDAYVRGCYSAATVSGESRVGGIAGNLAAGTVHWNVSNAKVSSTNGTVAYEVGNKALGATMEWNFYIGKEDKINDNDTHTYKITLHPNLLLMGFAFNISKDHDFDVSGVTIDANATVKVGDDLYGTADKRIDFSIPDISGGCKVENVKVNGDEPTDIGSGVYRFTLTADSQVAGDAAFNLYDDSNWNDPDELHNNIAILGYNRYRLANVTLQGRKLYKDGCWNTLCLPFDLLDEDSSDDLTFTGTPLEGATVKTLESSWFDKNTGTLNLTFSEGSKKSIEPGIPYIVKWPSDGTVIENPKFNHVVVEYDPEEDPKAIGNDETDAAIFYGNYVQVVFPENTDPDTFNRILYMGANNKLYYPKANGNVTINCFRGIFQLREDLAATDLQDNSVKSIVLDFGDGETDGISILTPTSSSKREGSGYFMLDGRHINGKPSQKGLYINNGRKIIIK